MKKNTESTAVIQKKLKEAQQLESKVKLAEWHLNRQLKQEKIKATINTPHKLGDANDLPNNSVTTHNVQNIIIEKEIKIHQEDIEEREKEIKKICKDVEETNSLFHELNHMIHEQSALINEIEDNIELASKHTNKATKELQKAEEIQTQSYCCLS